MSALERAAGIWGKAGVAGGRQLERSVNIYQDVTPPAFDPIINAYTYFEITKSSGLRDWQPSFGPPNNTA